MQRSSPDVLFQDYTKRPIQASGWVAPNYYMVRSITERDGQDVFDNHFGNVVVPVNLPKDAPLPDMFMGRPVVDGDSDDLRFLDPDNVVVALYAKGKAKRDTSGFVVDVA